MLHVKLNRHQ